MSNKPIILEGDGVFGQLENGGLINAGGTSFPTWTVGGRALLFADGTSTGGSGGGLTLSLQEAYDQSSNGPNGEAKIKLTTGKDFLITDDTDDSIFFKIDSETGKITITGDLEILGSSTIIESVIQDSDHLRLSPKSGGTPAFRIEPDPGITPIVDIVTIRRVTGEQPVFNISASGNIQMSKNLTVGLVNGVDVSQLFTDFTSHISGTGFKHSADKITVSPIAGLVANNVQAALVEINASLATKVRGYEHTQSTASKIWTISHNGNTRRAQVSVYDASWNLLIPDNISITNLNTIIVTFSAPISGSAITTLF